MAEQIMRMSSLPFGAFALKIDCEHSEVESGLLEQLGKLAVGTGQTIVPVQRYHRDETYILAILLEGTRSSVISDGSYVVRSSKFGRDGKAKLKVMNHDQILDNFGTYRAGQPIPDYPRGVSRSGYSEDQKVLRDNNLTN